VTATALDRVALFEADIAASPEALARLLDRWRPVDLGERSRIAFTGLGSSRYASLVAASALRARGRSAWAEHASSASATAPADDLVLVAVSASGRTPETVAAAERHQGTSLVVAVTNDPGSRLAAAADAVVALEAGEERSGIASRTFRATIAGLALLTGVSRADGLRPAVEALAVRLNARTTWAPPIVDALDGAPSIDVMADAALLGAAEQAALMLREAPRLPARAYDTADWLHTGVYLALPGHRALLLEGSPADAEVVATVERRGGTVARIGRPASMDAIAGGIEASIVAEVVAARLWGRTSAGDKGP
jgi:fructoselysine-6-P-deglycase FrlB-like protein